MGTAISHASMRCCPAVPAVRRRDENHHLYHRDGGDPGDTRPSGQADFAAVSAGGTLAAAVGDAGHRAWRERPARRNRRRTTSSINAWSGRANKTSNRWSEITRACGNVSGKLPSSVEIRSTFRLISYWTRLTLDKAISVEQGANVIKCALSPFTVIWKASHVLPQKYHCPY